MGDLSDLVHSCTCRWSSIHVSISIQHSTVLNDGLMGQVKFGQLDHWQVVDNEGSKGIHVYTITCNT